MVSLSKISDWVQIVGIFGVIVSLVFVGLQIQQSHEIAQSSVYQSRSNATAEWHMAATGSPELLSGLSKIYARELNNFTPLEVVALEHYVMSTFTSIENNHRQYELGFLSEEHWERNLANIKCWLESPVFSVMIGTITYRESFEALIADLAVEANENPSDCWNFDVYRRFQRGTTASGQ